MTPVKPLHVSASERRFDALLGTGGVGSGAFFAIDGNATLGREESRSGCLLDRRDYCKLHIIAHYVKALLGPSFAVTLASKVGADAAGRALLEEMAAAGLDMRFMQAAPGLPTLYSFCFVYPDGSGGNLTTADSAAGAVDEGYIGSLEAECMRWKGRAISLAAPEVPLAARRKLLELGTQYGCFRVASLTRAEAATEQAAEMLSHIDLLALNLEEAAALAGVPAEGRAPEEIARRALETGLRGNARMLVSITAGGRGSWTWDGQAWAHTPAVPVQVVGTAGAGDAYLAGVLAGLAGGLLPPQAAQLGALAGAFSVTSPHTIHKGLGREALWQLAHEARVPLDAALRRLLES